jgi:hypothetical protein
MLQYWLQPLGNFRCDYITGADLCDAFVTSTDSSYLLAFQPLGFQTGQSEAGAQLRLTK